MMKPLAIAILAALALPCAAHGDELDDAIVKFIDADGFESVSVEALEGSLDHLWLRKELVTPWGPVGPLEKAVLIATRAIPSIRTRTAISYGQMLQDDGNGAPYPVSFVEVRHYNMGPSIHESLIDIYDEVAALEGFGLGEHRAWRFVFAPVMNNAAALWDASTRTISNEDAADDDCTGRPCLELHASIDELRPWEELDGTLPDWPRLYPDMANDVATPAQAVAELAVLGFWASAESGQYQWTGGEHPEGARGIQPFLFIGIDRELGQESSLDVVWHETRLNDDAIAEMYLRRAEFPGDVYLMRADKGR